MVVVLELNRNKFVLPFIEGPTHKNLKAPSLKGDTYSISRENH